MIHWSKLSAREKNSVVAKKVMGWTRLEIGGLIDFFDTGNNVRPEFHPSTDIKDAMEVLHAFPKWWMEKRSNGYGVYIGQIDDFSIEMPDAICQCALRAKGVEIEE